MHIIVLIFMVVSCMLLIVKYNDPIKFKHELL